jgi:hypothetical protein
MSVLTKNAMHWFYEEDQVEAIVFCLRSIDKLHQVMA